MAIPCVLVGFAWRENRLRFKPLLLLFSAFILCCGFTHLLEAAIFWWPAYGLAGVMKLVTAAVSVTTVLALIPTVPLALAMRSPRELEEEVLLSTQEAEAARHEATLLVESSPAGVVVVDGEGRIVRVNTVTEQLFGYRRQEMLGRPIELLLPARFRDVHVAHVADYMTTPKPQRMGVGRDVFARHADGREFPVEVGLNPIESNGTRQILTAIVDVSERNRLRDQVQEGADSLKQANEALSRSNEALEEFAFVASHDLQEPLRKIVAFCQLLKEEQAARLDDDGRQHLEIIVRSARRLSTLVSDLLDFSRMTSTHVTDLRPIDANACLETALSSLEMQIEESNAVITHDELPCLMADGCQLQVVFQNLIGNALKYRGDKAPHIHIGARCEGSQAVLSISDNGIGIDPRHYDKIFGIFQRLHRQEEYSGTGIGLAHCKKLVEHLGGQIRVESQLGAGATFYVTLPMADASPLESSFAKCGAVLAEAF